MRSEKQTSPKNRSGSPAAPTRPSEIDMMTSPDEAAYAQARCDTASFQIVPLNLKLNSSNEAVLIQATPCMHSPIKSNESDKHACEATCPPAHFVSHRAVSHQASSVATLRYRYAQSQNESKAFLFTSDLMLNSSSPGVSSQIINTGHPYYDPTQSEPAHFDSIHPHYNPLYLHTLALYACLSHHPP